MLLAKTNSNRSGIRKHTVEKSVKIGRVSMRFMTIGLLAALALLYLAQSTQGAGRSYEMRALDQTISDLQDQQKRLEVESVRLRSLDGLDKEFATTPAPDGKPANWEQAKNVTYVNSTNSPIAQR